MIHKKSLFAGIFIGAFLFYTTLSLIEFYAVNNVNIAMPMTVNGKLSRIFRLIDEYYIYEYDKNGLTEGAYYGVAAMLGDDYTYYMDAETANIVSERNTGFYAGIGVTITVDTEDDRIVIIEITDDSPAEAAGLLPGDKITAVDGEPLTGADYEDAASLVRGAPGTVVTLTIYRESDGTTQDYAITREMVNLVTVYHEMMDDNIGYIEITRFDNATAQYFIKAFNELEEDGMQSLIIDLRGNGGGLLPALIDIGDFLVNTDYLLYTEDKKGERHYYYTRSDEKTDIPIVVLINGQSASASELLAAILSEVNGAVLVGETSFGKGSVQTTHTLPDGSAFTLTSAKYYTPGGVSVQGTGITPDYAVTDKDEQLKKAAELAAGMRK